MAIEKRVIKVRINGVIKTKQAKVERWFAPRFPNYVCIVIKHNGEDWMVGNKNELDIYELMEKTKGDDLNES